MKNISIDEMINDVENKMHDLSSNTAVFSSVESIESELISKFEKEGYDTSYQEMIDAISAAAEQIQMEIDAGYPYSVNEWWKDTQMNYPEVFEELEDFRVYGCNNSVMASDDAPKEKSNLSEIDQNLIFPLENDLYNEIVGRHEIVDDVSLTWDETDLIVSVYLEDGDEISDRIPYTDLLLEEDYITEDVEFIADTMDIQLDDLESIF